MGITMYKINGLITVSLLGLTACGGGSGGSSAVVNNGVFKDSNVSGLTYVSGDQEGVTDENGAFRYEEGTDVNFSIGAVDLGSGEGKAVMTPIDLVANGLLATDEVINRARFLMMLDEDNMPSNGIEISREVQAIADDFEAVDFTAADFPTAAVGDIRVSASLADDIRHDLPDAEAATAHLRTTLLCANAGAYVGSYDGTEEGNLALVVNPITGEVNGSSFDLEAQVSVEVNNTTALDFDTGLEFVSAEDSGKVFSGALNSTEAISGDWTNSIDTTENGEFTVNRLGGANNAVFRYTVAFIGVDNSNKGIFTFDVDNGSNITGTTYSVSSGAESDIGGRLVDNRLTATAADGTEINGELDLETLSLNGVWSNLNELEAGSFTGGGCRLN